MTERNVELFHVTILKLNYIKLQRRRCVIWVSTTWPLGEFKLHLPLCLYQHNHSKKFISEHHVSDLLHYHASGSTLWVVVFCGKLCRIQREKKRRISSIMNMYYLCLLANSFWFQFKLHLRDQEKETWLLFHCIIKNINALLNFSMHLFHWVWCVMWYLMRKKKNS